MTAAVVFFSNRNIEPCIGHKRSLCCRSCSRFRQFVNELKNHNRELAMGGRFDIGKYLTIDYYLKNIGRRYDLYNNVIGFE